MLSLFILILILFPVSVFGNLIFDLKENDTSLKLFSPNHEVYLLKYYGPISNITTDFFEHALNNVPKAASIAIQLSSQGGSYFEMKKVAKLIRNRCIKDSCETYTYVQNRDICYSACVFLYLTGTKRVYAPEAQFGFHAATLTYDGTLIWTFKSMTIRRLQDFGMNSGWLDKAEADGVFDRDNTVKTARQLREEGADIFDLEFDNLPFLP